MMFRCGTCGKLVPQVMRVVIDQNYNRSDDLNPLYNCPECFEKKNRERKAQRQKVDARMKD